METETIIAYMRKPNTGVLIEKIGDQEKYTRGKPYGVMMCRMIDGGIRFGWSKSHVNDTFNKKIGKAIATERLRSNVVATVTVDDIPIQIGIIGFDKVNGVDKFVDVNRDRIKYMIKRCKKVYKL